MAPPGRRCDRTAVVPAITHWLAMGGFAQFVWPAYGIAAGVLGGLAVHSWRWHRASRAALDRLERPLHRGRGA
jgi:heme exporter protein D